MNEAADLGIQPASRLTVAVTEERIDEILSFLDSATLPGAAIGVALAGRPIYRKAFGVADIESGRPLTPTTPMRIQSVTKHFTCLAYLLLCEEGRARLDDRVGRYCPDLAAPIRELRVSDLMGHISGLTDVHDVRYQFSRHEREVTARELVDQYRTIDTFNFAPGTGWSYCNGGYSILTLIIEAISGLSLEDFFEQRIFRPLGMTRTRLCRSDVATDNDRARSYARSGESFVDFPPVGQHSGSGGIVSTVDDMLAWLAHMDAPRIGSPATWRMMMNPTVLKSGTPTGYGLGLIRGRYRGLETIGHSGGLGDSNSLMLKVPEAELDFHILVNRGDVVGASLVYDIIDRCIEGLEPAPRFALTATMAGRFRSRSTGAIIELSANEGRQLVEINGETMEIVPSPSGEWEPVPQLAFYQRRFRFNGDAAQPARIDYEDFGNADVFEPVEGTGPWDMRLAPGCYASATLGSSIVIRAVGDELQLMVRGPFGRGSSKLDAIAHGTARIRREPLSFAQGIVSFDADGLTFSNYRNRDLRFARLPGDEGISDA